MAIICVRLSRGGGGPRGHSFITWRLYRSIEEHENTSVQAILDTSIEHDLLNWLLFSIDAIRKFKSNGIKVEIPG